VVRRATAAQLPQAAPFCVVLDDTLLRRSGHKTPGVAWRRDPLGPRFQTNFVRAQRFLQFSAVLPANGHADRAVPIAFLHAPTPPKPSRKASPEDLAQYRKQSRDSRLSLRAAQQIRQLREDLDRDPGGPQRPLILAFDGGYTNATVLRQIPHNTICIGRIRKDARLCFAPDPALRKARGRHLCYGAPAPTQEQFRTDDSEPWQTIPFVHAGVEHQLRYKRCQNLLWRTAGAARMLQLIVIAPLAYRPRKGAKLLYREPAFLICTDATLDPRCIIEAAFQRWEIEVNFREQKTLLGIGQAQVRDQSSVESAPALGVASYAMLLVAAQGAFGNARDALLPRPKWAANKKHSRVSTQQLLQQLRAEVWGRGLGLDTANFSGFTSNLHTDAKPEKCSFPIASAVCYANA